MEWDSLVICLRHDYSHYQKNDCHNLPVTVTTKLPQEKRSKTADSMMSCLRL
jgi:hypothetical protein